MSIWFLDISSFRGVSLGAQHWYAKVRKEDLRTSFGYGASPGPPSHQVEVTLTKAQAAALNAADSASLSGAGGFEWRAGMETGRWVDETAMRAAALALFLDVADPGDILRDWSRYLYLDDEANIVAVKPALTNGA
jgi:hypothetical protein